MPPEQTPPAADSTELDEFAAVFDSLTEGGTHAEGSQTDTTDGSVVPSEDDEQQSQPADGAGDSGQSTAEGGDAPAADGAAVQDDGGHQPAGSDTGTQGVDWEARFRALEAAVAKPPAPALAPEPEPVQVYTPEEKTELDTLSKDWPDIVRLFTLLARQQQVDTLNYAFSEVGKVLTPLQASVATYNSNDHLGAILEAHSDYEQVYQPVLDWVEKQPGFLKEAYQNVVKQGTAEDVSMLIQRFKDETKWVSAPSQGAGESRPASAASTPAQQQTGLSEAAKKAAKAMGAVGTKRGASSAAQDPLDFDGAWDEAVGA